MALDASGFEVLDFGDSGFARVVGFAAVVGAFVAADFVLAPFVDRLFAVAIFLVGFPFITSSPFRERLSRKTNEDLPISLRKYPQPLGKSRIKQ